MGIIKRYLKFVKPYRMRIIGTLAIGIIKFAIPLLIPVLMKIVIDDILTVQDLPDGEKTSKLLWTMAAMLFIFEARVAQPTSAATR